MQAQLFCATCTTQLEFNVPELIDNRWYANCRACGKDTALEAKSGEAGELATFNTAGVHSDS
jgi:hypothetical protein